MAKLLIVDDDAAILTLTTRILESVGHAVLPALGGARGIATFQLHEPQIDAVLMDILMPEVDGITAFQRIRQCRPDVPFLFVTGSAELLPETVRAQPRVAVLSRPFYMAELVATVDWVLAFAPQPLPDWPDLAADQPSSTLLLPAPSTELRPPVPREQ